MTEAELQNKVQVMCGELGLLWHHCRDSRHCSGTRGFPDLVVVGGKGILLVEFKAQDGDTTADQDMWRWYLMRTSAAPVQVWRPSDLESGLIRAELGKLACEF